MEKKKINYFWLIPLIIGIIIGSIGVSKIIQASKIEVPSMGDFDWFNKSTKQSSLKFTGIGLAVFGFVFIGTFGTIATYMIPKSMHASKNMLKSTISGTRNFFKEVLNPEPEKKPRRFCNYCDAEIPEGSTCCDGCGSKSIREEDKKE